MVKSYRDLVVWQKAMTVVESTYRLTSYLPKSEEFGLKSQMRRASISIPSNIAEGHSRNYPAVFLQFLSVAQGSLSELETQIELAVRLEYYTAEQTKGLCDLCLEVCRMLHGLVRTIRRECSRRQSPCH
jgi:four helix bundle protein